MSRQAVLIALNWAESATKEKQEELATAISGMLQVNGEVLAKDVTQMIALINI